MSISHPVCPYLFSQLHLDHQNSPGNRLELEKIYQCPTKLLMLVDEVLDHQCQPIIYITLFENTHLKRQNKTTQKTILDIHSLPEALLIVQVDGKSKTMFCVSQCCYITSL